MTTQEFKETFKNISGIVLFKSGSCSICKKEVELFDKVLKSYIQIDCENDPDYFITNHGLDLLPEVRIYEDGNVVWKKTDFVSEEDIQFLINYVPNA
jgi:hypothetical protein